MYRVGGGPLPTPAPACILYHCGVCRKDMGKSGPRGASLSLLESLPMIGYIQARSTMLNDICLLILFISTPLMFAALILLPAPYGRYASEKWGPTVNARAGWMLMELPGLGVIVATVLFQAERVSAGGILLLSLWAFHYAYRSLVFPFLIRERGKRFPILLIAMAVIFNSMNGYANGTALARLPAVFSGAWLSDLRFFAGCAVFVCGFVIHVRSDSTLRNLRGPGETGYKIPRGGLFEWVACPNYFGEVLEWAGWALASWSPAGLAFALFTAANLVPRADAHWRWYRERFPEYPSERKRVIPYLF